MSRIDEVIAAFEAMRARIAELEARTPPPRSLMQAEHAALQAAHLLVIAYEAGLEAGGEIAWEDLDRAHAAAKEAVRLNRGEPFS